MVIGILEGLPEYIHFLLTVIIIVTLKDNNKLVSSDPVNRRLLKHLTYRMAAAYKIRISRRVSESVVYILQPVYIHHYNGKFRAALFNLRTKPFNLLAV